MRRTKSVPTSDESHACNHGDVRICGVCQYNDDCPFLEADTDEIISSLIFNVLGMEPRLVGVVTGKQNSSSDKQACEPK